MQTAVRLADAVVLSGGFPVLAGLSLDIDAGKVVWVRGPNGAGKTSLLRTLAGLLSLSSGEGVVMGCDLTRQRGELRQLVGWLGAQAGLYGELTVEENLRFLAVARGQQRADWSGLLDEVGLPARVRDVAVRALSTGQRRRVALAALVQRGAPLWLLDEPHGALDPAGLEVVDRLIRDAARRATTVVVVSHDHGRASQLCDAAVTLVGGHVESVTGAGVR